MNKDNTLWVEKYRPATLEDYIGNDSIKSKVSVYLKSGEIPHLLLYGKAGTGKTTLAKLIIKNIDCDHIYINASDENNVDTVRNKIRDFSSSVGFTPLKVVILDEADYMTPNGQAALRNLMETFSKTTRFILTCNYVEKIIDPIQSRCQVFGVLPPGKLQVARRLRDILNEENVELEKLSDMVPIVDATYPDIRRAINALQMQSVEVLEELRGGKSFTSIRKIIADSQVKTFEDLYRYLYDNIEDYAPNKIAKVILIISDAQYQDAFVVDKEINIMAMFSRIIGEL